ncbi:arginine/serine-rich coiled-coil protein 2 isoform X2 [Prunus yedoensis var. nudiflora]|uniref:Arginine/serine-rich coiled-coil protein 2 isoform X2 n=1 Tax=Prunus yedoensis var. nudiflora TaxID=2094558 RepID=A0A314ZJF1_PRUYE|nr:arginine/serine-rich coiled-coil protein 2 isoform X2 [Prunus yedoensis var. nudiflora]
MKTRLAQTDKAQTRQKRTTPKAKDEGTLLFFPDAQEGTLLLFLHAQTLIRTDESESTIILTHSKALVVAIMDSNFDSPPAADGGDAKAAFRKPATDAANRKYRRRSPVGGSSPSDGSPMHEHNCSPKNSREDPGKVSEYQTRRRDDGRELERDSNRRYYGRSSDSYRHSDRQSSKSSHGSRDYSRNLDKYSRDKYDGSGYRNKDKDRESSFPENQKYKDKDSSSLRVGSGRRHGHFEEMERERDRHALDRDVQDEKKDYHKVYIKSENQESTAKRPKLFSSEKGIDGRKDVSKFTTTADGRESSSSKQVQEDEMTTAKSQSNDAEAANDINAAKVAALKAAELVNRNLIGVGPVGCMTADQKKKLLWGNKKSTTAEEVGHRWDTTLFPDRERQEKFNKLMGVKGEVKVEQKPENEDQKQKELQMDLEKQYTAGLRRRDGRTVGLGL